MKRTNGLYRAVMKAMQNNGGDSVTVLVVFPPEAFADAPYWEPGPEFEICIPNRTWYRDNPDGTMTLVAAEATPKLGITGCNGEDPWTDPEIWTVQAPAGHPWIDDVLWDKPHRITWFTEPDEDEVNGLLPPSVITSRVSHVGHPLTDVQEYWETVYNTLDVTPRRLAGDHHGRYGVIDAWPMGWRSDFARAIGSLSELVYRVTRLARQCNATIHILPN